VVQSFNYKKCVSTIDWSKLSKIEEKEEEEPYFDAKK
jgi:hypothetical protein